MLGKDAAILRLMLETIDKIMRYTSDLKSAEAFEKDVESFDATMILFF